MKKIFGKRFLIILTTAVLSLSFFSPSISVSAKTLSQLKSEREQLAKKSEEAKKELDALSGKKATVQEEMDALDKVIMAAQAELDTAQADLDDVTARLVASEEELAAAIEERDRQFEVFKKRIKYLHENGNVGYLEIIINAESFADALTRVQYVQDIMEYDKELLDELKATQDRIEKKTEDIKLEKEESEILLAEKQEKKDSLDKILQDKSNLMEEYMQSEDKYNQLIESTEKASKNVERLINEALATSDSGGYVYTGGKLNWPVPAKSPSPSSLSSGYVSRNRPIGRGTEFHTGYDIPAPYGSNIVAAEAGTVIYSGWMSGYGNTIMINHGSGLVTLYGHNSSLVVKKGATVTRGQVVAKCGSTGNSTGNHCHFEVRLNGGIVSPEPYLGVKNISY